MPWVKSKPPVVNKHTAKAEKFDRRADKALRAAQLGDASALARAVTLRERADKVARKGGWF